MRRHLLRHAGRAVPERDRQALPPEAQEGRRGPGAVCGRLVEQLARGEALHGGKDVLRDLPLRARRFPDGREQAEAGGGDVCQVFLKLLLLLVRRR